VSKSPLTLPLSVVDLDSDSYRRNTGSSEAETVSRGERGTEDPTPSPSPGLSQSLSSPASMSAAPSSPALSASTSSVPSATPSTTTRPKFHKYLIPARTQQGESVFLYLQYPVLQLLRREDRVRGGLSRVGSKINSLFPKLKIQEWPFKHMRGYGQEGKIFQVWWWWWWLLFCCGNYSHQTPHSPSVRNGYLMSNWRRHLHIYDYC